MLLAARLAVSMKRFGDEEEGAPRALRSCLRITNSNVVARGTGSWFYLERMQSFQVSAVNLPVPESRRGVQWGPFWRLTSSLK